MRDNLVGLCIYLAIGIGTWVLFWDQHIDFHDGWFYVIVFAWPYVWLVYILKWVLIVGATAFVMILVLSISETRKVK